MQEGKFSSTAHRVAVRRAAHQLLDNPKILEDPLALRIIGREAADELRSNPKEHHLFARAFRAFMVARSRYAEDELAKAVAAGVGQYVVLGAGLDTFAYRNSHPGLKVFEVDHPATQAWKREQLEAAEIPLPSSLAFVPVDFERKSLEDGDQGQRIRRKCSGVFFLARSYALPYARSLHDHPELYCSECRRESGVVFDFASRSITAQFWPEDGIGCARETRCGGGRAVSVVLSSRKVAGRVERDGISPD
jgi:hypothetical protein